MNDEVPFGVSLEYIDLHSITFFPDSRMCTSGKLSRTGLPGAPTVDENLLCLQRGPDRPTDPARFYKEVVLSSKRKTEIYCQLVVNCIQTDSVL